MSLQNVIGTVMKCGAYQLKEPDTFVWEGKSITNTHRLSMLIKNDTDGVEAWYGLGSTDKDNFFVKRLDGEGYAILGAGSKVLLQYIQNGDFKNAKKSGLTIMNLVEGKAYESKEATGGGQGNTPATPFDLTGIKVGHAINAALEYYGHKFKPDNPKVEELAKELHTLGIAAEAWCQGKNPGMSKRDVGASVGHAVRNACKANMALKTKKADPDLTTDQIKTYVQDVLALTVPLSAFIKGEELEEKATPKEEVVVQDVLEEEGSSGTLQEAPPTDDSESDTPW